MIPNVTCLVPRLLWGVAGLLCVFLLSACESLPANSNNPVSAAFDAAETTALGRVLAPLSAEHAGVSGFNVLDTGREALNARLALIEAADHAVDAQYYIWNSDASGRYLARRLLVAADRGVRIRLLLDDVNIGDRDNVLAILDSHPNVEIRIYNPFASRAGLAKGLDFLGEFGRLNRRMHNKTFVVDGAAGIVGGRNVGDEYFDMHPQLNFRDRELLAVGPIVRDISANFDAYWNSPWAYPISLLTRDRANASGAASALNDIRSRVNDASELRYTVPMDAAAGLTFARALASQLTWAPAELVFDEPTPQMGDHAIRGLAAQALGRQTAAAQSDVLIESAYFVLGDEQLKNAAALTRRGVRVRVLTNSMASNDLATNHAAYARHRRAMLERGLELYEFRPDAASCKELITDTALCSTPVEYGLHAKSVVFDRKVLYVGSFNANLRSTYLNFETVLIVHSPELAERVARDIETNLQPVNSWRVQLDSAGRLAWADADAAVEYDHEPMTSWWSRFKVGILKMLPMEKYF